MTKNSVQISVLYEDWSYDNLNSLLIILLHCYIEMFLKTFVGSKMILHVKLPKGSFMFPVLTKNKSLKTLLAF